MPSSTCACTVAPVALACFARLVSASARRSTPSPRPARGAGPRDTPTSTGTGVREASASTAARRPPCVRTDGRMPCASSRSSTFACSAWASASPMSSDAPTGSGSSAWLASCRVMIVWTRRCCAPSCRSRTTRRRSSSVAATIRARDAASSERAWTFAIAVRDELGEVQEARLGGRRERPRLSGVDDQGAPEAPRRRGSGCRPRTGSPSSSRAKAASGPGTRLRVVDPGGRARLCDQRRHGVAFLGRPAIRNVRVVARCRPGRHRSHRVVGLEADHSREVSRRAASRPPRRRRRRARSGGPLARPGSPRAATPPAPSRAAPSRSGPRCSRSPWRRAP